MTTTTIELAANWVEALGELCPDARAEFCGIASHMRRMLPRQPLDIEQGPVYGPNAPGLEPKKRLVPAEDYDAVLFERDGARRLFAEAQSKLEHINLDHRAPSALLLGPSCRQPPVPGGRPVPLRLAPSSPERIVGQPVPAPVVPAPVASRRR
jgi:hypothetical protein